MPKRLMLSLLPTSLLALALLGAVLLLSEPPSGRAVADPASATPVTDPDGRLGVCYAFYEEPQASGNRPYLDLMVEAGARHDRWDFSWSAIQPDNQQQWEWNGHEDIVRVLLEAGADPNVVDDWGHTPLYWALENGHVGVAELLREGGAIQ